VLELNTLVLLPPSVLRRHGLELATQLELPEPIRQLVESPVIERGIDRNVSLVRGSICLIRSESRNAERLPVGPK
jgi:hypothetical protein